MRYKKINLIKSTKQVFDECANVYLKEDKHWGCDLDVISKYIEQFRNAEIIELGTGYAWHLANLFFRVSTGFKRIVGIDYSDKMITKAKLLLNSIFINGYPLSKKVELQKANILSLPFDKETFDVAILLNNTLGNIPGQSFGKAQKQRKSALREIYRVLKKSGFLILSVYDSSKLSEEDTYGKVFNLDRKLSKLNTYDLVVRFKETKTPYYSHWFDKKEISGLLLNANFRIDMLEERNKRIIIAAQKKQNNSL